MIKLQVIGNLGNDANSNVVNGKTVINFNVAHTEKFKNNKGDLVQRTIWVSCAYWTDRTGVLPYLRRGTQVYVEGAPEVKTYEKRNGGGMAAELSLRVVNIQLLGSRQENSGGGQSAPPQPSAGHPSTANADDITEPIDDLPF